MKCVAVLLVDLERSPLGTAARLETAIGDVPVLRRTVQRLRRATRIAKIVLLCPPGQATRVAALVEGLAVDVEPTRLPPSPYGDLVRAARWWGLDAWRGGPGALCAFDEDADSAALSAAAARHDADVVAGVPAAAALIDPDLVDRMIEHFERLGGEFDLTFAPTPPGLTPFLYGRALLAGIAPTHEPPGLLLSYRPEHPAPDLTGKSACYRPSARIIEASGRLICDTRRSTDLVAALIGEGAEDWDAERISEWLNHRAASQVDDVPREIEIELTTNGAPAAESLLRPTVAEVPARGPLAYDVVRSIASAIREYDDVRMVLAGHGDPVRHEGFEEVCRMLRPGAAALAVRTYARQDAAPAEDALFETPVDVVEVMIDAVSPGTYRRVHGVDAFDEVTGRVERWLKRREQARTARPLIVPSFVKCDETVDEMEDFYEQWQRRLGMALITGHGTYAGQRESRAVTSMTPPARGPCRRAASRLVVLADGTVTTCDQDFRGLHALGRLPDAPLGEIWRASRLERIRRGDLDAAPLCAKCDEWHRP